MTPTKPGRLDRLWPAVPWLAVFLYLALALFQLGLPGLHYDEAKEAGVNAMEMLLGQDVHAFRAAGIQVGNLFLPIMVQDYIGALTVYLTLPFLAIFGITVPALRLAAVLAGLLTLIFVRLLGNELSRLSPPARPTAARGQGHAGDLAMLLLAVSPSFLFWSRQGIFVTNLVVTLAVAAVWAAVRWWRSGRPAFLYLFAVLAGLGLWTKLLFVWVLGALAAMALVLWLVDRKQGRNASFDIRNSKLRHWPVAGALFLLALLPLILFNQQTGGTFNSIFGNLGNSYYGVQNSAFLANVTVRLQQVATMLRGDHFWYLGGLLANRLAPWIALAFVVAALAWRATRQPALWSAVAFVGLLIVQSAFTVSDLFITHFAIVQPFVILLAALAADQIIAASSDLGRQGPEGPENGARHSAAVRLGKLAGPIVGILLAAWIVTDLSIDLHYHQALAASGGHASHSDASYRLAQWLDEQNAAQPLALDWGFEAPVRFLTENRVQPLEIFGYERLDLPDAAFETRLVPFLDDPARVFLLHTAEDTVFQGRRELLERLAAARGKEIVEEAVFHERSGRPVSVAVRVK